MSGMGSFDGARVGPWHTDNDGDRARRRLDPEAHYDDQYAVWVLAPYKAACEGAWVWYVDGGRSADADSAEAAEAAADAYLVAHGAVIVDDGGPAAAHAATERARIVARLRERAEEYESGAFRASSLVGSGILHAKGASLRDMAHEFEREGGQ